MQYHLCFLATFSTLELDMLIQLFHILLVNLNQRQISVHPTSLSIEHLI